MLHPSKMASRGGKYEVTNDMKHCTMYRNKVTVEIKETSHYSTDEEMIRTTSIPLQGRNLRSFRGSGGGSGLRQLLPGNTFVVMETVVRHVVVAGDIDDDAVVVATLSFVVIVDVKHDSTFTGTVTPPGVDDGCLASPWGSVLTRHDAGGFAATLECLQLELLLVCLLRLSLGAALVLTRDFGAAASLEPLLVVVVVAVQLPTDVV